MKVFGIAGWSGSGKTTLIERLLPRLAARGQTVSVIKHAHCGFDVDRPGKDSWRHREAGAARVLVVSENRWVLMSEQRGAPEPSLDEQLKLLGPCDVVLIEGYKRAPVPKIEVHRPAYGREPLWRDDPHIVAVATDVPIDCPLPQLALDDADAVARFIVAHPGRLPARPAAADPARPPGIGSPAPVV